MHQPPRRACVEFLRSVVRIPTKISLNIAHLCQESYGPLYTVTRPCCPHRPASHPAASPLTEPTRRVVAPTHPPRPPGSPDAGTATPAFRGERSKKMLR